MKILKISLLTLLSVFAAIYIAFLLVLPYAVDLNQYTSQITSEIEKATGFKVKIKNLKVKTAWNFSGGAFVSQIDLKYPTGEKFAQINDFEAKLSLLPLFLHQIRIDSISAEKAIINLKVEKNGKLLIENYLPKSQTQQQPLPLGFKLSSSMPDVKIDKYKIAFINTENNKTYAIKGSDFKIQDFVLDKKIKVKAIGDLILDGRKQIGYNLSLQSKILPGIEQKGQKQAEINILQIFENLYKYNLCANISADLKISGDEKDSDINGDLNLEKIAFTLNGKKLPQSNLKLKFKKNKIKIDSDFYTDTDEKATITGVFDNGRKKSVNLNVHSDKTDIANTFLIANSILELFGKTDLEGIKANGALSANFNIKSDFKKIQSAGYLRIKNAQLTHSVYKASLNSINADIDFSQNEVNIKKSSAMLNGAPISIKGSIDSRANANISVFAQNLQLKSLLATLGQADILRENNIYSGIISIKASLKGRLDKAIPTIDVALSNVSLKNIPQKALIKLTSAKIKALSDGKKINGSADLSGLKIHLANPKTVTLPSLKVIFDEKDLTIQKSALFINSSQIDIEGKINDYQTKKMSIDIIAKGFLKSNDIKSLIPKENQKGVVAVGKIPVVVKISGNDKKQHIQAQILANSHNCVSIFDINSLRGKTSLINADLTMIGDKLKINEINLYSLNSQKVQPLSLNKNFSNATKIIHINGDISNTNSSNPNIHRINVNIPNQISTSIPGYPNSVAHIKGDLTINGSVKYPDVKGYLSIPEASLPTMKTTAKNISVNFNKNSINLSCPQIHLGSSLIGFDSVIDNDFSRGIIIKTANFNSSYVDLDSIGAIFASIPQNVNAAGVDFGIVILKGNAEIDKFKTGSIIASDITSNFELNNNSLKMHNVKGYAYGGKIGGNIVYNLTYGKVSLDLQGRGLSAGPAIKSLSGRDDGISGQLDFDSDISMIGYTPEQILRSLKGSANFIISNGKMGTLGKLEHLLYAQNVLSNNIFKTTLNIIAKAVMVKNTGLFRYIKGQMTFSNGWAHLSYIKTSGASMSMYINGDFNLINNSADLTILGRLADDVVKIMGPLGELSMDKMLSYIPKLGNITSFLINQMTTNPEFENTSSIPDLTPKTGLPTKEFKVIIYGPVDKQNSVKSFKWLSKPKLAPTTTTSTNNYQVNEAVQQVHKKIQQGTDIIKQNLPIPQPTQNKGPYGQSSGYGQTSGGIIPKKIIPAQIPDFINSLPDLK